MRNWLQDYRGLFDEATERCTEKVQKLSLVEEAVSEARKSGCIDADTLKAIEEKRDAWSYMSWWPPLSHLVEHRVPLSDPDAVHNLFDQIHNIEVTSVAFRFVMPDEFGIFSPPVAFILNVVPGRDSVGTYERYCKILRKLRDHYGLSRVADVDMALWTTSVLQDIPDYDALKDQMQEDEFFQETRLTNLLQGPGSLFPRLKGDAKTKALDERRRLLFAKIVVKDQHFIGALVAARSFEVLIKHLADEWDIKRYEERGIKRYEVLMGQLARDVGGDRRAKKLGYSAEAFGEWWDARNKIVHGDDPISSKKAKWFVDRVVGFAKDLQSEGLDLE